MEGPFTVFRLVEGGWIHNYNDTTKKLDACVLLDDKLLPFEGSYTSDYLANVWSNQTTSQTMKKQTTHKREGLYNMNIVVVVLYAVDLFTLEKHCQRKNRLVKVLL
eukprot:UN32646